MIEGIFKRWVFETKAILGFLSKRNPFKYTYYPSISQRSVLFDGKIVAVFGCDVICPNDS